MCSSETNVKSKAISLELYVLVCFVCLMLQLFWSQYYEMKNLGGLFAIGSDLPSTVSSDSSQPIFGKHFFGDLLDGHQNFSKFPSGAYFGMSYLFFWLTSGFSYKFVFICYVIIAISLCIFSLRRWLSIVFEENKGMVYALHFSYPFIFAADRGQISLFIGYMTAIGLSYLITSDMNVKGVSRGQAILGAAFSMKIYSVFITFAFEKFWSFKKWRHLLTSFFVLCISTPLIFLFSRGSLKTWDTTTELYLQDSYFVRMLYHNTSLKALIFHIQRINFGPIDQIFEILYVNYFVFYIFYASFLAVFLRSKYLQLQERLLAFAILSISFAPIAAVYTQTLVCAVALVSLTGIKTDSKTRQNLFWLVIVISTVPLNIPLLVMRNNGPETFYQSLLVPFVQHSYVILLVGRVSVSLLKTVRLNSGSNVGHE